MTQSRSLALRLQQAGRVDLTLGAGLVEEVTVQATTPLVDPQRTGGELRVSALQSDELPIAARAVTDLALLDSSVRPAAPGNFFGEPGSVFVINGQTGRSNSFLVDGLDNNDQASGTTLNAYFSQQVIGEFVVLTHQYAPEFGRASGGILNLITERGTNELRGEWFGQGTSARWNQSGALVDSLPATTEQEAGKAPRDDLSRRARTRAATACRAAIFHRGTAPHPGFAGNKTCITGVRTVACRCAGAGGAESRIVSKSASLRGFLHTGDFQNLSFWETEARVSPTQV